jgi:hypothetical protein
MRLNFFATGTVNVIPRAALGFTIGNNKLLSSMFVDFYLILRSVRILEQLTMSSQHWHSCMDMLHHTHRLMALKPGLTH